MEARSPAAFGVNAALFVAYKRSSVVALVKLHCRRRASACQVGSLVRTLLLRAV